MNVIISQYRRFLPKGNGYETLEEDIAATLCYQYPQYRFFLLTYDNYTPSFPLPANAETIKESVSAAIKPLMALVYRRKLKALGNKLRSNTIVHINDYVPLKGFTEFLLLTNTTNYKPGVVPQTVKLITPSLSIKNELIKNNTDPLHIKIISLLPNKMFMPLDWDAREKAKEHFTDGKEYYLFNADNASPEHFVNVLKGFSMVKKWLKSGIKLIVVNAALTKHTTELIDTYKYKTDLSIFEYADALEYSRLVGASFAFIFLPQSANNSMPLIEAVQCAVPAIIANVDLFKEVSNDAALYIDPTNEQDIGEKMIKLYKDEKTRSLLIQKSAAQLNILAERGDKNVLG